MDSLHVTDASFSDDALDLARRLADAAVALHAADRSEDTARITVELARALVPAAHWVGVSEFERGSGIRTVAHSDDVVRLVDALLQTSARGPAAGRRTAVTRPPWRGLWDEAAPHLDVPDVTDSPAFGDDGPRVAVLGPRAVLAFRLRATNRRLTVLTLYARSAHAFDATAVRLGEMLSTHAGIALEAAAVQEQLTEAMQTRDVIGQATGVLMGKLDIDGTEAFRRLVRASQKENVKVRHIARRIVESAGGA